jgi:hypothetical protein
MGRVRLITAVIVLLLFGSALRAKTDSPSAEATKHLPEQIGSFKAAGAPIPFWSDTSPRVFDDDSVMRAYVGDDGGRYSVQLQTTENDAAAFALLTHARALFNRPGGDLKLVFDDIGTASFTNGSEAGDYKGVVCFYKGRVFVSVMPNVQPATGEQAKELARELAKQLDAGEGEIPVLIKHLPDAGNTSKTAIYSVSLENIKEAVALGGPQRASNGQSQPVLDVLDFDGGTEAVAANYGQSQLVIVEFTTPQFSVDNDSRIWTRIAELKSKNEPTPTAYRRVGNYSVFVFNAADDKTANGLIDQVKYEQVVQWLGDDPHLADRLQRYLTQTSAGVLVAVLKSSGLSLVLCLGIGGLVGALLFRHRRAQRAAAFSDAGGSIRLNLDELTDPTNRRPLLPAEGSREDPAS